MEQIEVYTMVLQIFQIIVEAFVGWAIFRATSTAPVRAVQDQKNREQEESAKNRKLNIFYTLMQTRNDRISYRHTEALNMIDMEFNGINDITYSWSEYLSHLNTFKDTEQWQIEGDKLFINMLYEMSKFLGYNYTKLDIQNKYYSPQGHYYEELNQGEIKKHLADVLAGRKDFPVIIKNDSPHITLSTSQKTRSRN